MTVTANQASTQNFTLTGTPLETVSGTATAGTGTAWPLYAQVSWSDANGHSGTTYTTPATGAHALSLLENTSYTLTVTAQYPSTPQGPAYQQGTATVAVATSGVTQKFALPVNVPAKPCHRWQAARVPAGPQAAFIFVINGGALFY